MTALLVIVLYLPVSSGGYVGVVDKAYFRDLAWLRSGHGIWDLAVGNFYGWSNYFRPLVVALFAIEEGVFAAPGPMHLVSLGLHLANTLLVGVLAHRLIGPAAAEARACILCGAAMVAYGIHPALVEPVVSISCQFDLVMLLFVLLGLIAHVSLRQPFLRAITVASCYLLAAAAKESAAILPLLAAVCDWTLAASARDASNRSLVRRILREKWLSYLGMLIAGLVYLALRSHALGTLLGSSETRSIGFLARFQTSAWLYLTYWRILIWPMAALSPIHEASAFQFARATPYLVGVDLFAAALVALMAWLVIRRRPFGSLMAAFTLALLPVLRLVPIDFDSSLYHERYAMAAIAGACALFPRALAGVQWRFRAAHIVRPGAATFAIAWMLFAVLNVTVSVRLWLDETKLWQWVTVQQPDSLLAKNFLLEAFLARGDYAHARPVAESLEKAGPKCPLCLLNVADFALKTGDIATARLALDRAAPLLHRLHQPKMVQAFEMSSAKLLELENRPAQAEENYRRILAAEPMNPYPRLQLAILLARRGERERAQREADQAIALMAPGDRQENRELFQRAMKAAPGGSTDRN